jgi:hypothetical protein
MYRGFLRYANQYLFEYPIITTEYLGPYMISVQGGMAIDTIHTVPTGEDVNVSFSIDHYHIRVLGKVLYEKVLPLSNMYGIMFNNLDDMTFEILRNLFILKASYEKSG